MLAAEGHGVGERCGRFWDKAVKGLKALVRGPPEKTTIEREIVVFFWRPPL
jgi:hypothetical protein